MLIRQNTHLLKCVLLLQLQFSCWQSLLTNVVNNIVCIKNPIRTAEELATKKWPRVQKINKGKDTLQSMSLCNVLSQSVLSGAKLLKHLAHTKKLADHLAAMATHFRGQWASPRQPITPLNPPPPFCSYVFHLSILPSPLRHRRGQGSGHAKGSGHCPDTLIGQLI